MPEIDKADLYGKYQAQQDKTNAWQGELTKQMSHKALDIPVPEDMNIKATTNNTTNGASNKVLLGVAAVTGIPLAVLAGLMAFKSAVVTPTGKVDHPAIVAPAVTPPLNPATGQPLYVPPVQKWQRIFEKQNPDGTWSPYKAPEPVVIP